MVKAKHKNIELTLPKSLTSNRSKGSNSSLLRRPNLSWHTLRNVLMFFKHRNYRKERTKVGIKLIFIESLPCTCVSRDLDVLQMYLSLPGERERKNKRLI